MAESLYQGGVSIEEVRSRVEADTIYKLSSNENALGPSPHVLRAIQEAAAQIHMYPPREDDALRERLVSYHDHGLSTEQIFTGNSGSEVVELINRAFVQAGDEVIICSPTFGLYKRLGVKLDLKLVDVPLDPDTYAHDIPAILEAVTDKTRLVYICNPNNPTGTLLLKDRMEALLDGLPGHVLVVADEVYHHFVSHPDYPDSIQSVLDEKNIIVVHSFSKAYGLAGLRLGYGIARTDLVKNVRRFRCPFHLNALAHAAGLAALEDTAYLKQTLELVRNGLAYFTDAFKRLGIRYWPSETNFIMIKPDAPAKWLEEALLKKGFMVRPTDKYGIPGGLRITVGTQEANEGCIQALESLLKAH